MVPDFAFCIEFILELLLLLLFWNPNLRVIYLLKNYFLMIPNQLINVNQDILFLLDYLDSLLRVNRE